MSADWWQNFANNFAADLAPLLSLFGEQATKQFLSETLTFVDIAIFSIAPIGVLTAVVSAIRVGGDPSLRAFIGRAQEGGAYAEAELCSSTSRDVCELYTTGGIARVFGRPKILEIVHDPSKDRKSDTAGIYTFEDYSNLSEQTEWTEKKKRSNSDTPAGKTFADHPNLSLNIGIKKLARPWFYLAAAFGLLLQGGVLVFAALATYVYPDIFKRDDTQITVPAFPFTFAGTILLCTGVGLCATVVESSTKERVFKRHKKSKCRLHWVQPGGQVIGDQVFDSFTYSETSDNLLDEYTTSWKPDERTPRFSKNTNQQAVKKTLLVWTAIITTCVGFVLQFLGIRTLHSSVSVAQFVVMVVMSLIRALLRTQRLKKSDNQMGDSYALYQGHELDWLAIKLACEEKDHRDGRWIWQIVQPFEGFFYEAINLSQNSSKNSGTVGPSANLGPRLEEAFLKRARLARLTGALSPNYTSIAYSSWDSTMIASRELALVLAKAIEGTMALIYNNCTIEPAWKSTRKIIWSIPCGKDVIGQNQDSQTGVTKSDCISFTLRHQIGSTETSWKADRSELEAALGLWIWSIRLKDGTGFTGEEICERNSTEFLPCSRILLSNEGTTHSAEDFSDSAEYSSISSYISTPPYHSTTTSEYFTSSEDSFTSSEESFTPYEESFTPSEESLTPSEVFTTSTEAADFLPEDPPFPAEGSGPMENNLKFWLGDRKITFRHTTLRLPHGPLSPGTILTPLEEYKEDSFSDVGPNETGNKETKPRRRRLFGCHLLPKYILPGTQVHALEVLSESSLELMCAQEIFSAFLMSLSPIIQQIGGKTEILRGPEKLYLKNQTVSDMVRNFAASGIGSEDDALTCIVPAMYSQGKLLHTMVFTESRDAADACRRRNDWTNAEQSLLCALDLSFQASTNRTIQYGPGDYTRYTREQTVSLLALCELYRWALSGDRQARLLGFHGILSICKAHDFRRLSKEIIYYHNIAVEFCKEHRDDPAIRKILDEFNAVKETMKKTLGPDAFSERPLRCYSDEALSERMEKRDLAGTLYLLKEKVLSFRCHPPALALAARNGWVTVVKNLLELGANPEETDQDGLNYLHYASKAISNPETFLQLVGKQRYLLNRMDKHGRIALHLAAGADHKEIVGILMDQFSLDPHQWDLSMMSSFEYALSGCKAKTLAFLVTKMVQKLHGSSSNVMWDTLMQIAIQVSMVKTQDFLNRLMEELDSQETDSVHGDIKKVLHGFRDTCLTLFQQFDAMGCFKFYFLESTFRKHFHHGRELPCNVALSCKAKVNDIPRDRVQMTSLDYSGRSCLHFSIKGGDEANVKELLNTSPDVKIPNIDVEDRIGRTALAYAFGSGNLKLTSLLRKHHAGVHELVRRPSAIAAHVSDGYRLYFQDTGRKIREMVIRSRPADKEVDLSLEIAAAKAFSPLAVVGRDRGDKKIHVYYISEENQVCEAVNDGKGWFEGTLSSRGIEVTPQSGLAVSRTFGGELRVFYQDMSGDLKEIQSIFQIRWGTPKTIRNIPLGSQFAVLMTPYGFKHDFARVIFQTEDSLIEEVCEDEKGWYNGDFFEGWAGSKAYQFESFTTPSWPARQVFWTDFFGFLHEATLDDAGRWKHSRVAELEEVDPDMIVVYSGLRERWLAVTPICGIENGLELRMFYQKNDGSIWEILKINGAWSNKRMVIPLYDG